MIKTPPIIEGEEVIIEITSMGRKGDGIGRYNDFVILVPDANFGDKCKVLITKVYETFAFGIVQEKLEG